jgi:hypothetical protein
MFLAYFCLYVWHSSEAVGPLPRDHEVMGSCPENSILQKCREKLRI